MSGSSTVTASNGVGLPLDSLEQTFTNNGTVITSASVTYIGVTYTQTFTYSGSFITDVSQWVAS